jgi:hypothetical protein
MNPTYYILPSYPSPSTPCSLPSDPSPIPSTPLPYLYSSRARIASPSLSHPHRRAPMQLIQHPYRGRQGCSEADEGDDGFGAEGHVGEVSGVGVDEGWCGVVWCFGGLWEVLGAVVWGAEFGVGRWCWSRLFGVVWVGGLGVRVMA